MKNALSKTFDVLNERKEFIKNQPKDYYSIDVYSALLSEISLIKSDINDLIDEYDNTLGMYLVDDPSYPKVKIGKFTLCKQDDNNVWIQIEGREGAQFSNENIEKLINDYFNANF